MNCKNCGEKLPEQTLFCSNCGHDLRGDQQFTVKIELPKKIKTSDKLRAKFSKNVQSSKIQLYKRTSGLQQSVKKLSENIHSNNIKLYKKTKEFYDLVKKNTKRNHVLVIIVGWTWVTEEDFTYVRGSVKNVGNKEMKYFEINVKYKDENKNVLDSDFTNWDRKIQPGECKEFEIVHHINKNYQSVDISINKYK